MKKLFISFSGGETSAYMLYWLLKHKSSEYEIKVVFSNTGNENEETLVFVQKCSEYFNVEIIWVEAVPTWTIIFNGKKVTTENFKMFQLLRKYEIKRGRAPKIMKSSTGFKTVDFETASRDGGPFEKVIQRYGIPNKKYLHCTRELKLRPMTKYIRSIGWKHGDYHTAIGIRVDEIDRVDSNWKTKKLMYPLVSDQPMSKPKINFWWSQQPFRLKLKGYEGNCKDCYKKSENKLMTIAIENEDLFDFTKRMTTKYGKYVPYQRRVGRTREELNSPINFFRGNTSPFDLIQLAKTKEFKMSGNDADVYDFEGVDPNDHDFCNESCEVNW